MIEVAVKKKRGRPPKLVVKSDPVPVVAKRECLSCAFFVVLPEHGICHEGPQLIQRRTTDWCGRYQRKLE